MDKLAQVNFSSFPKILGTFNNKNLATTNCVKDWGKVAPGRVRAGPARQGMIRLVRSG